MPAIQRSAISTTTATPSSATVIIPATTTSLPLPKCLISRHITLLLLLTTFSLFPHYALSLPATLHQPGIEENSSVLGVRYTATPIRYSQIAPHLLRHRRGVSPEHPIHILFPLPMEVGRPEVNPFGITIDKARPVVDEAVEEVYRRQLVEVGSLAVHFEDSKLSDAHGPNVAINQLVDNRLDCIIGGVRGWW